MAKTEGLPLFTYATLRDRHERSRALGHPMPDGPPTHLRGYQETLVKHAGSWWPSMWRVDGSRVDGELLEVTAEDLQKLDDWESNYRRARVDTDAGSAWTYLYTGKEK